ncbi:hypothetical protein HY024_03260 [Candidatus Curtissbacteria bacterium]|nr:hypothetical protein [Candidatus Curtissbacteria bacterium]
MAKRLLVPESYLHEMLAVHTRALEEGRDTASVRMLIRKEGSGRVFNSNVTNFEGQPVGMLTRVPRSDILVEFKLPVGIDSNVADEWLDRVREEVSLRQSPGRER